jgi:glycosyltransferase involved in cell wall biosynthesis
MLRLALALRERGHDVWLACPAPPPGAGRSLAGEADAAGLSPALGLTRGDGLHPLADLRDVRRLRRLLEERAIDVAHVWHSRDHLLALRAAGALRRRVALLRSWRHAEAVSPWPWNRWLFGSGTDGMFCVSPETARRNAGLRGGRPIAGAFGAVDLERFEPRPSPAAVRAALGLSPEHHVVGIVARVQAHRRFDLLLEAGARLFARDPRARLLVVGRGTRRAELAESPARRMGIGERVVFAGYRAADYADVLRSIDVFTYLVPGSDGTCRALLEAASCGIPAVTTRRGALAEIVAHGETGLLVDEDPEALASAWASLLADPQRRARLGRAARARAEHLFAPERFAAAALSLYGEALAWRNSARGARRTGHTAVLAQAPRPACSHGAAGQPDLDPPRVPDSRSGSTSARGRGRPGA